MKIKFLKAFNGDSIHLRFDDDKGKKRNILIDGGTKATYKKDKGPKGKPVYGELKTLIDKIRKDEEFIDLLIITHIDEDHIGGILKWFTTDKKAHELAKEVWFNSGGLIAEWLELEENLDLQNNITLGNTTNTSTKQGIDFGKHIKEKEIWGRKLILQGEKITKFGLDFRFLSPRKTELEKLLKEWKKKDPDTKTSSKKNDYSVSLNDHINNDKKEKDDSIPNGSSIAFILTYNNKNLLFTGDAYSHVILSGLNHFGYTEDIPLEVELMKLPHHGSKKNLFDPLLSCIKTDNYAVTSNGSGHQHPDKQALARVIKQNKKSKIYFNYEDRMKMIFTEQDKIDYPDFEAIPVTKEFEL